MNGMCWRSDEQWAEAGNGAPSCFRHVQPSFVAAAYDPAVIGGMASRLVGATGWPTGLVGDAAG